MIAFDILYCVNGQLVVNVFLILLLILTEIGDRFVVFKNKTGKELTDLYNEGIYSELSGNTGFNIMESKLQSLLICMDTD